MRPALAALHRATRGGTATPAVSTSERAEYDDLITKLDAATTPEDQARWREALNRLPPHVLQTTSREDRARYLRSREP